MSSSPRQKVVRTEKKSCEGQSRGMPRKDAGFTRALVEEETETGVLARDGSLGKGQAMSRLGLWPGTWWKGWRFMLVIKRGLNSGFLRLPFPHL